MKKFINRIPLRVFFLLGIICGIGTVYGGFYLMHYYKLLPHVN